jgi:hypothetical protein
MDMPLQCFRPKATPEARALIWINYPRSAPGRLVLYQIFWNDFHQTGVLPLVVFAFINGVAAKLFIPL